MKTIFKLLALLLATSFLAHAQDQPPQVGFLRIVNAISPGAGNASFLIDGKELFPGGYKLGQTTGGYGVKAGSITVEVRKEGLEKGVTKQKLDVGETVTIIAFAEKLPPDKDKPEDPPKWGIKLLKLKQKEVEKGFGMSIVSVSKADEIALKVNIMATSKELKAFAKRLTITSVDIGAMRSEIMIKAGEKVLTTVSPDSRGNYVVIVYDNADDQIEALYFYDPKFVIAG